MVSDEIIEMYADSYLPVGKIAELIDVDRNTIMRWHKRDLVRMEQLDEIKKGKPYKYYHFGDCVVARAAHKKPRPFKNCKIDGVTHYQCNTCDEWKTKEEYYTDKRNKVYGILCICKSCHNKRSREREKSPEAQLSWRRRSDRRKKKRAADAKAATAWSENPTISASVVIEAIDEARPNNTDYEISNEAGVHTDTVRMIRRRAERGGTIFLSTVDSIFTNLNEPDLFVRITQHLDDERPRWHEKYDYCQMCLRTKIPYAAKGFCTTCYPHRNNENYVPMVDSSWSLRYAHCKQCYSTSSRHAAHGLCNCCYQANARLRNAQHTSV